MKLQGVKVTNKSFLALFSVLLLAWVVVYQEALLSMEAIWSRSDTFAHGYFILPISLWLVWRDKEYLLKARVSASILPLPLLFCSLFVWLFAYAADINVLGQVSAVISLILLVWLMIGNQLTWRYKFPLAYLLFAVPMGENLIPWLQDVTAWFTVFFLKVNGIPVYVDGLYIQIPTGMFEVAVACSGIRYLIASIAVGTLFGYLTYNRLYKQILFVIFAIGLPILANGIRAYGIVAIAYYSDMEYATGADHLIYGWLFFGLVIMLMFWVGGLFADKQVTKSNSSTVITSKYQYRSSIVALLIMGLSFSFIQTMPITIKPSISAPALHGKKAVNSDWGITFFNSISRSHVIDDTGVEYVVAKFANRQTEGELISSNNVLFNPDKWTIVETQINTASEPTFKFIIIRSISGHERTILFRYVVGTTESTSKVKVKITQAWHSLFHHSSNGYVEAVSVGNSQTLTDTKSMLIKALGNFRRVD